MFSLTALISIVVLGYTVYVARRTNYTAVCKQIGTSIPSVTVYYPGSLSQSSRVYHRCAEPGLQDLPLTMMVSLIGRLPVLNNPPVWLNPQHQRMLDPSYVYHILRFYPLNSHPDQLKVLGDTKTPFAVRHLSLVAENHQAESAARSRVVDTAPIPGFRQPWAFTSQ